MPTTPPSFSHSALQWLFDHSRETVRFTSALECLGWDQRTMLAPAGHPWRGEQLAALTSLIHGRLQDPARGDRLAELADVKSLSKAESAMVHHWQREHDRAVKIPESLARSLTITATAAETAWETARPDNDWAAVVPHLQELLALKKEEAACLAKDGQPFYDALLDEFEPGETSAALAPLFDELEAGIAPILDAIKGSPRYTDAPKIDGAFPVSAQERLNREVCQALGFSFQAGRLDTSAHPFSCAPGPHDHRITTRYNTSNFLESLYGVLHETGHSLYEIGLPEAYWGTPMGQAISLGIHESQSRLWENLVGRSAGFCRWLEPHITEHLGVELPANHIWQAANRVSPSLIRVEADEVTYCLHVILRFRLETGLMAGDLALSDLPAAWDDGLEALLGVRPDSIANGCMQDMHWFAGAIGYFPTYALGTMYASQFFDAASEALGGLDVMEERFSAGDFQPLLGWLREQIHGQGMQAMPHDLVRQATGAAPSPKSLLQHLNRRYSAVYGL